MLHSILITQDARKLNLYLVSPPCELCLLFGHWRQIQGLYSKMSK